MSSKSISKSVVWQLGGKFALQGIAFFTTPIFTRLLSPEDFGYTALYASWLAILNLLVGLCTGASINNARITFGEDKLSKYISSIMTISVFSFIFILLICFLAKKPFSTVMGMSSHLVIMVVIQSFFAYVISIEISRFDALKEVEKSTFLSLLQSIALIAFSLFFVLLSKENKAEAKIYGQALPTILIGLIILFQIYRRGCSFWNSDYCKFCLSLTLPLILHKIGQLVFGQTDRIMLEKMYGGTSLGIYSVTFSLCSVLTIISVALNTAWGPFYMDYKKNGLDDTIIAHSKRYIKFYTLVSIGFILLAEDVFKIMAPEKYYDGIRIIPLFVLSNFFNFLYFFPVNFEFYLMKTKVIPIATIVAAVLNVLINWIFIPMCGILGAAIGTLVAHIFLYLFHEITARVIKNGNYEYKNPSMFIFASCIMIIICICSYLFSIPWWCRWSVAVCAGGIILLDLIKYKSIF